MRIAYPKYNVQAEVYENQVMQLVVESPQVYAELIEDLIRQCGGESGEFILSEGESIKVFAKEVDLILNPFALECNERKIQQKLYQEISQTVRIDMAEEISRFQSEMIIFMDKIIELFPYHLDYDMEENIPGLIKCVNIRIDENPESLLEKVVGYLRIMHQLCRTDIYFFVNLKSFLCKAEIEKLYEFAFYQKIVLVLLESEQREKIYGEKSCILDKDKCIIYLE